MEYFSSYERGSIHREMILDNPRTSAYRKFISENVAGKQVLEIGSGSGILSVFAAKAGAKVVAVEAASAAVALSQKVIAANAADVTVLEGQLEEIIDKVKSHCESFDVIISEWMGYALFYENMLPSVLRARDRCGGSVEPRYVSVWVCGADYNMPFELSYKRWDAEMYGLDLSALKPEFPAGVAQVEIADEQLLCTAPVMLQEFDLASFALEDGAEGVAMEGRFDFDLKFWAGLTSLVVYFDARFSDGTVLHTGPLEEPTHWKQTVLHMHKNGTWLRVPPQMEGGPEKCGGRFSLAPGAENARHLRFTVALDGQEECEFHMR